MFEYIKVSSLEEHELFEDMWKEVCIEEGYEFETKTKSRIRYFLKEHNEIIGTFEVFLKDRKNKIAEVDKLYMKKSHSSIKNLLYFLVMVSEISVEKDFLLCDALISRMFFVALKRKLKNGIYITGEKVIEKMGNKNSEVYPIQMDMLQIRGNKEIKPMMKQPQLI